MGEDFIMLGGELHTSESIPHELISRVLMNDKASADHIQATIDKATKSMSKEKFSEFHKEFMLSIRSKLITLKVSEPKAYALFAERMKAMVR